MQVPGVKVKLFEGSASKWVMPLFQSMTEAPKGDSRTAVAGEPDPAPASHVLLQLSVVCTDPSLLVPSTGILMD